MSTPSRREFVTLLDRLGTEAFARFLAALWVARGREVTVDGDTLVVDGRRVRVHTACRRLPADFAIAGFDPGGADAVATTHPGATARLRERGIEVMGPTEIRRATLYGIDRREAEGLCREHLDRSLDREPRPGVIRSLADLSVVDIDLVSSAAVVSIILAIGLVAAVGVPIGFVDFPDGGDDDGAAGGTSVASDDATTPDEPGERIEDGTLGDGVAGDLPPGVTTEGVQNASALSRAHADAAVGRSYEWRLEYSRSEGGNPVLGGSSSWTQIVRVEDRRAFRRTVLSSTGPPEQFLSGTGVDVYAQGDVRYVRTNGSVDAETSEGAVEAEAVRAADRAAELVARFLASGNVVSIEATTREGENRYLVTARGIDTRSETRYRAIALVEPSGFVPRLEVSYLTGDDGESVSIVSRYSASRNVTVERPGWTAAVDAAQSKKTGSASVSKSTPTRSPLSNPRSSP
ncbi:MAG: hypothetical protein V5A62_18460 [Haloarculaceae archaeon]